MEADDRSSVAGPLVEVVHSQTVDVGVVRCEVVTREIDEAVVRCAEDLGCSSHRHKLTSVRPTGHRLARETPSFESANSSAPNGASRMKPHSRGRDSRTQPASSRSAGTSSASARPRCDAASFSAGLSSAADRADPSGTKIGS